MYIESPIYREYDGKCEIIPVYLSAINNYHIFTKARKIGLVIQNLIRDNFINNGKSYMS